MKDHGTKALDDDAKVNVKEDNQDKVNNIEETDSTTAVIVSSEPTEHDDIESLVNHVKELNIQPEDKATEDEDGLLERGPNNGIPRPCHTEKNIPINPFGNFNPVFVPQPTDNGRRDFMEECPRKFIRPNQQPQQPPHQQSLYNFQQNAQGGYPFNNLNAPTQDLVLDFKNTMYNRYNVLTNSGGKVTVQSPPATGLLPTPTANAFSDVDSFLDSVTSGGQQNMPNILGNPYPREPNPMYPPMTSMGTHEENVLSPTPSVSSVTMRSPINERRPSDPLSDSGVESAEEKSPYSDVVPSPTGSNYSVESGYGPSPQHEPMFGQTNIPMTTPNYPGIMSPGPHRVTPSPASSAGYYSPMEFFDDPKNMETLEDAMAVIQSDLIDNQMKEQQTKRRGPVYSNTPPCPINMNPQGNFTRNQAVHKPPINYQQPGIPVPVQMIPSSTQIPNILPTTVTTTGTPGSIIIVQNGPVPNSSLPVIYVNPIPKKEPAKPLKPRKILPKTSTTMGSTTHSGPNNASSVTMTSSSKGNTNIMAPKEGGPAGNRNFHQMSSAQAKRNQDLLMIARRTVAEMTVEALQKSDDEGDTYLHIAVCKTDKHMVQALLERLRREGLDNLVDQENNKRQTPLYLAVYINQPVMVAMFIKFQANVNVLAQNLSSDGMTREVKAAIHVAASQGHEYVETLQQLLQAKDISINIVNNYGQTALHCAISAHNRVKRNSEERINSTSIIKLLIKAGADASAQDQKSGKTPLMYAIEQRDYILVETILSCIEPSKMRNVVRTQAFDGSSCLKIAEGLKDSYNVQAWNKLWNSLQSAASGSMRIQPPVF